MIRHWKKALLALLLLGGATYAAALGYVYARQENLLFHPDPLPVDHAFRRAADVQELSIPVPGATLSALSLQLPHPKAVVFFLHGNGGNLESWFINLDFYRRANVDLFMIDYRGYGKSTGRIDSEAQLRADVRAAWDSIATRYAGIPRVVYGRSLGTGLAAGLSADVSPALTVLVSPYCSMQALAAEHFPLVPAALLRYPLDTCADAARIHGPMLLVHGQHDTLVPPHHSEELLAAAPQAHLLRIPDAAHNDVHEFEVYRQALRDALAGL